MSEAFTKWITDTNKLLADLETLAGRCRTLSAPPQSADAAARVDALTELWLKCGFAPLAPGSQPWADRASLLAYPLNRAPEEFLRLAYAHIGQALAEALRESGSDSKSRLIATERLPFYTFVPPGTIADRFDNIWTAVALDRLAPDHCLRQQIKDGWRGELGQESAVLGPAISGRPAPLVSMKDILSWTENLRSGQRREEFETERKRKADEEERRRAWEASERGRLDRIEKELAGLKK